MKVVSYKGVGFIVATNCNKTFSDFAEHEKHYGFTRQELKEVFTVIQQVGKEHGLLHQKAKQPAPEEPPHNDGV